jgi:putative phosphoribosyl transferase
MSDAQAVVIVCSTEVDAATEAQLAERGIELRLIPNVPAHDADAIADLVIEAAARYGTNVALLAGGLAGAGALIAAAERPDLVTALVVVNGRTDLAFDDLRAVKAPTFLLVSDMPVLLMNREAVATMRCEKRIEVVHGVDSAAVVTQKAARWLTDRLAVLATAP